MLPLFAGKMNLSDEVDLEDYVARPDRISGSIMHCSFGSIKGAQVWDFDRLDCCDFFTINPLWVGDFGAEIKIVELFMSEWLSRW